MQTIQIRLTKDMVNELRMLVEWGLYPNVSEAVRDGVRRLITGKEAPIKAPEEIKGRVVEVEKKLEKELIKEFKKVKGTVDFYPEDKDVQNKVFAVLRDTASKFGFLEVDAPLIESLDLLKAKQGEDIISQIFTIEKKGDEELALRAEFTPSLTRMFIAKQKSIPKPVKWFCIGRVFRYEKPQTGRLREFFQFNVEVYGSEKPEADAEVINLAIASLRNLGLTEKDFFVKLNNRKLLQGLLLEMIDNRLLDDVIRIIDKKDKITDEEFYNELKKLELTDLQINRIKDVLAAELNDIKPKNDLAKQGLAELKSVLRFIDKKYVKVDLSTARGLAYYTGTVFEVFDTKEKFRSIAGGGRYDNMVEQFRGQKTAATGFGLGYATLNLLLKEKSLFQETGLAPDYFIAVVNDNVRKDAFGIAERLRKKYRVEIDLTGRNLRNQLDYANSINAKKVVIVGPKELEKKEVNIRDMKSGKEERVRIDKL